MSLNPLKACAFALISFASVSRLRHPTDRRSSQNYFCLFALDLLSRASLLGSLYGFQGTSGSRTSVLSPGCLPLDSLALLTSVRTPRLSPRFRSLVSLVRQLCYYTSPASFCQHLFPFFFPSLFTPHCLPCCSYPSRNAAIPFRRL